MNFILDIERPEQLAHICGSLDTNLEIIAKSLDVSIMNKGCSFTITGDSAPLAVQILKDLSILAKRQNIDIQNVQMAIKNRSQTSSKKIINIKTRKKLIHVRNNNQQHYVGAIENKDCVFSIGPAGTGKTYLAVAKAVEALEHSNVRRIVLVRPAVQAGEKLGFLPGDLTEKVDPYLRPIYDALYEMLGFEKVTKLIEKNIIEVAPLAFMRGRSLNEAFIILDEAQNTTTEQMKMFLTRLGFGSKMVVTGDISQIDLTNPKTSGLLSAIKILNNEKGISFCYLKPKDIFRHKLVQRIVLAYEKFE